MAFKIVALLAIVALSNAAIMPLEPLEKMTEIHLMEDVPIGTTVFVAPFSAEYMYVPDEELEAMEQLVKVEDIDEKSLRTKRQINIEAGPGEFGGTDLSASAQGRLWESRNGRTTLDGNLNYERRYGGQFGTSRPNYGGGFRFSHSF